MLDYQIQASSRRCTATGRELKPGEAYYSVLLDQAGKFLRHDYSLEAWQGKPAEAFCYWRGRIPTKEGERKLIIDDELLLECFHRLEHDPDPARRPFRYVVSLLLMRRKRLKFEDVRLDNGQEWMRLRCLQTKAIHEVLNPHLTDEQMESVQDEVFQLLGWQ